MMTFCSAFLFPVPFSRWVISIKRYWIILTERRRWLTKTGMRMISGAVIGYNRHTETKADGPPNPKSNIIVANTPR
jgi:hypothetical protein